ncbi:glycosyltransferase [Sphingobacterium sp. UT-1RO-CII-1]|uniref:glycosyltransferase family protein n=1 Tax=Sphingobacterium sp. UT-1RO-CII-1 TaxID=2995225 RepID=UPI00227BDA14|nr:glycosyltransferase family protein [Sphingobacterium sp. UT-1RO-CII-1]MCY4781300.1 glycosyltransferase [Sphingobacterium sp. UT-1RO-CII-1]
MKILYAVQGTGNGHLIRALDIIPILRELGEVDVLVSGIQADIQLPFEVKYRLHGLSFIFGKSGGVDLWRTFLSSTVRKFVQEINSLPVQEYDLVINDFEPISAWACQSKELPCIGLSHQIAALDPASPKPDETDTLGKFIMKNYAPSTQSYGFHFKSYSGHIFTPVIRKAIRELEPQDLGHYTVYLPSYDDAHLLKNLSKFSDIKWDVYSKHNKSRFTVKNVTINPIEKDSFMQSMANASGVLCGAGFETPAEALHLGKKLLVVPMKNQYEQHLNAAALDQMGVPVINSLKKKYDYAIESWLNSKNRVAVNYPDVTQEIITNIVEKYRK